MAASCHGLARGVAQPALRAGRRRGTSLFGNDGAESAWKVR